jgi:hypothetical protein
MDWQQGCGPTGDRALRSQMRAAAADDGEPAEMVMRMRQSPAQTLWVSTTARPAGSVITPDRNISAGLLRNSPASVRNARR